MRQSRERRMDAVRRALPAHKEVAYALLYLEDMWDGIRRETTGMRRPSVRARWASSLGRGRYYASDAPSWNEAITELRYSTYGVGIPRLEAVKQALDMYPGDSVLRSQVRDFIYKLLGDVYQTYLRCHDLYPQEAPNWLCLAVSSILSLKSFPWLRAYVHGRGETRGEQGDDDRPRQDTCPPSNPMRKLSWCGSVPASVLA